MFRNWYDSHIVVSQYFEPSCSLSLSLSLSLNSSHFQFKSESRLPALVNNNITFRQKFRNKFSPNLDCETETTQWRFFERNAKRRIRPQRRHWRRQHRHHRRRGQARLEVEIEEEEQKLGQKSWEVKGDAGQTGSLDSILAVVRVEQQPKLPSRNSGTKYYKTILMCSK